MNIDLRLGDCLEVMKTIEDNSIDAIITDPPYGTTACKWDSVIDFDLMWEQLNRIVKPNGAIVLFGSEPFSSALRMSNIKNYKYDWIWDKERGVGASTVKYRPMKQHEIISIFANERHNYYPIKTAREKILDSSNWKFKTIHSENGNFNSKGKPGRVYKDKFPTSILSYHKDKKECNGLNRVHPTQKPIDLMEYLIKTYTKEQETVLDFTMGSGSTMVACVSTNRNGIGIEMDENYFNIAKKRVEEKKEEKDNEPLTLFNAQT